MPAARHISFSDGKGLISMNISIRSLVTVSLAVLLFISACSSATPAPALPPSPTASLTPIPTATNPPPTATSVPTSTLTPTPTPIPIFWDDFSGEFQPGWTWVRENDALWSLDSEPGFLRIVLQNARPPRNLLVRDVTSENFQIMTHVRFKPTSNFQFAGLLVYQNDDTLLSFGRAYCDVQNMCVGNGIYFDATQNGQFVGNNFGTDTQVKDEAYLRIDKNGTKFTGYYSENGADWVMIGEHEVSVIDPKVGIITANSFIVGMTAYFDYFTVMETP